jgi:hypothetical protein
MQNLLPKKKIRARKPILRSGNEANTRSLLKKY